MGTRVLWAVVALGALSLAQEPEPESPRPLEKRPPTEWTLGNGFRACLAPMDTAGEAAVLLCLEGAGFAFEPKGMARMAQLAQLAVVLHRDDPKTLAAFGRWLKVNAVDWIPNETALTFEIRPKRDEVPIALKALASRFFEPSLEPTDWKVLRPRILGVKVAKLAETPDELDTLSTIAWSACNQIAFHVETDVRFADPSPSIDAATIRTFHRATFRPERAGLAVLGDFDVPAARNTIEALFAKAVAAESRPASRRTIEPGSREGSWDLPSHQLFMLWPAPPREDESYAALRLFAPVLRSALKRSPDVVKHALEVKVFGDAGGLFAVQVPLRVRDSADAAARAIRSVFATLAAEPFRYLDVTKEELRRNASLVDYPGIPLDLRLSAIRGRLLETLRTREAPEKSASRVDAITSDSVHAAMKAWLAPEKATIVTVTGKE
jgi:Peptidase M16 inactive domain